MSAIIKVPQSRSVHRYGKAEVNVPGSIKVEHVGRHVTVTVELAISESRRLILTPEEARSLARDLEQKMKRPALV